MNARFESFDSPGTAGQQQRPVGDLFAARSAPMGVLQYIELAKELGFQEEDSNRNPDGWVNFSRGEAAENQVYRHPANPTAPYEQREIVKGEGVDAYGPVGGIGKLRSAFAGLYNRLHRPGLDQFTPDNVSIRPGGRAALTATLATFGRMGSQRGRPVTLGHFHPDYSGYMTPLTTIRGIAPTAIALDRQSDYRLNISELEKQIRERRIEALLLSNPCNPTGTVIANDELRQLVELSKRTGVYIISDEFYDDFIWTPDQTRVSSADYIEKIDSSRVIIISGLSKAYQAAGWRIAAVLGGKKIIAEINNVAGGLDGGANHPLQVAAIPMLTGDHRDWTQQQRHADYKGKREVMLSSLREMGILPAAGGDASPEATFYVWADVSELVGDREPIDLVKAFVREKVIPWVPGEAFCVDTDPATRNQALPTYKNLVRVSFGPRQDIMEAGLDRMRDVVRSF